MMQFKSFKRDSIITQWELFVNMATRIFIRSSPKPSVTNPRPMMQQIKLVAIGLPVSEILVFESVNARTDAGLTSILKAH